MTPCRQCGDAHAPSTTVCPRTDGPVSEGPCGTRIDRYEIERLVASGGMGSVYRARHAMLNQPVALKLLRRELAHQPDVVSRFVQEARAAASIASPHIVQVTDFGVAEGAPFLAMELLEGRDLESLLRDEGPLPPSRAVAITREVLAGLSAAHAAGVVHRDMKPANVFLVGGRGGAPESVKLLDFGISKVLTQGAGMSQTRAGTTLGTPYFMAPEQFRDARDVDARADVYAAAAMLYQLLTARLPHEAGSYEELVVRVCTEAARPIATVAPQLPAALCAAVDRGLHPDRAQRFESARAFADALAMALGAATPAPSMRPPQHTLGNAHTVALSPPAPAPTPTPYPMPPLAAPGSPPVPLAYAPTPPPFPQQTAPATPAYVTSVPAPNSTQPTHPPHATQLAQPAPKTKLSPLLWLVPGVLVSLGLVGAGLLYRARVDAPDAPSAPTAPSLGAYAPPPELTPSLFAPPAFHATAQQPIAMQPTFPSSASAAPSAGEVDEPDEPDDPAQALASAFATAGIPSANGAGLQGVNASQLATFLQAAMQLSNGMNAAAQTANAEPEPTRFAITQHSSAGGLNGLGVIESFNRRESALRSCASRERGLRLRFSVIVHGGRISLVSPLNADDTTRPNAICVAVQLRSATSSSASLGDGVGQFDIALPRRS